jgi:AraC-like DNA-binding protein
MDYWLTVRDPSSVNLLVKFGEERGVPSEVLLRKTGLAHEHLVDPNVEIQAEQELLVINNLIKALKNPPLLGLEVGLRYGFTTYGVWGLALMSSATVGDALSLALRFQKLTSAFTKVEIHQNEQYIVANFQPPPVDEPVRSFLAHRDLAGTVRLISEVAGATCVLSLVELTIPRSTVDPICDEFMNWAHCPVKLGAKGNTLMLNAHDLNLSLPNANPLAASLGEQMCAALQERRRVRYGIVELVRSQLLLPTGNLVPDLPHLAKLLYTSERTLKRRLQAEGTSFRKIFASVQQQLACELLQDSELSINEIAVRTGYSDDSAFSQAFKRWKGITPGQWRRHVEQDKDR